MDDGTAFVDPAVAREAESPAALREWYEAVLAEALEDADEGTLAGAGVDDEVREGIRAGETADVNLEEATAAIAAADGGDPDALLDEVRDALLLGMSSAMLDVDRVSADVEGDLDPKEVQGKVEGRHPMTLSEYARIYHYVANAT